MTEERSAQARMVAVQLRTDEGAFICNVKESDIKKIDAGDKNTFVVIHRAIRLDSMFEGQYELHETKVIKTLSIDSYRSLQGKPTLIVRKGQTILGSKKERKDE
jgi:hypothetical protein